MNILEQLAKVERDGRLSAETPNVVISYVCSAYHGNVVHNYIVESIEYKSYLTRCHGKGHTLLEALRNCAKQYNLILAARSLENRLRK